MEDSRIKYWMTKDNWSTLVTIITIKRLSDILPRIRNLIQESGLVESYHFRYGTSIKLDECMVIICYRMLRKVGCTNNQLESSIGEIISKLIPDKCYYAFNPREGNLLKTFEKWLDPYESARRYKMSHIEWVTFIEILGKFSDITTSLAKENFLSLHYRKKVVHMFRNILLMDIARDI